MLIPRRVAVGLFVGVSCRKDLLIMKRLFVAMSTQPLRTKISLLVIALSASYLILGYIRSRISESPKSPAVRIQQVNMSQAKLCLMKIDATTAVYKIDSWTPADLTPYEVWYTHSGEVDIVLDLTRASVVFKDGVLNVLVPEPEIDKDTCNIRPKMLKRIGSKKGWRTEAQRTKIDQEVKRMIAEDLKETVVQNFPVAEAKSQAERILHSLYCAVGCSDVKIDFCATAKK